VGKPQTGTGQLLIVCVGELEQAAQTVEDGICRYGFHPYQAPWILQSTLLLTLNIIFF